jgi:hypothetical protein
MQLAIYLSVLVTVVVLLGVPGAAPVDSEAGGRHFGSLLQQSDLDVDQVLLRFDVRGNGSAVASVEYRFRLDGTNDTSAFSRLEADVNSNRPQYLDRFERRVNRTVETASNATGRSMRVTDAAVRAETRQLPRPYGVVVYTFTWHGFAAVEGRQLSVGDALAGLYLDEGVQLQITWPGTYDTRRVHDGVSEESDRAAVWTGPLWFGQDGPRLVLAQRGTQFDAVPIVFLGLSAAFALGGIAFWWRGRRDRDDAVGQPRATPSRSTDGPSRASSDPPMGSTPWQPPDESLMRNEERVLREIADRGGRVKQQELVSALGWSDAKVSRTVSTLREQGAVEGFRLGNENILSLSTADDETEDER